MRHALPILAALALAACQPQAPDGKPASAPADAPPMVGAAPTETAGALPDAFKGDLHVVGTEPFWSAQVREKEIAFNMMDPATNLTGPNNGAVMQDGRTDDERKSPRCDYYDERTGKKYGRRGNMPQDAVVVRKPRVSKWRFTLALV